MAVWRYLIIFFLFIYLFFGIAASEQYRTNLESIELIKDVPLSSDIYSEVVNIKSTAILFLSYEEGNTRNADNNKFVDSIKKFLEEFDNAFQKSRTMQPEAHKEGVDKIIKLKDETIYLESLSKSSQKLQAPEVADIVNKEKTSINRFLDDQAKYFEDIDEKEIAVPLKIEYLKYAVMAYHESRNAKYESVKKKYEETESNFNRYLEQALNFSRKADETISGLEKNDKGLFDLFSSYIKTKDVIMNYLNSIEIYYNNGISDKTLQRLPKNYAETYNELLTKNKDAEEISSLIFKNLIISLLETLTPWFLVLIIFMLGFRDWKKDSADTKLNKIVRRA